jgi:FkbH-like protein
MKPPSAGPDGMDVDGPMTLREALRIIRDNPPAGAGDRDVLLACGFSPLHLATFLGAHLRRLDPGRVGSVRTGLYGDCLGNLGRLGVPLPDAVAVVIEWDDLDPRLGLRRLGGWGPGLYSEILANAADGLARFSEAIAAAAERSTVAVCLPTLPLPPISFQPRRRGGSLELELAGAVSRLSAHLAGLRRVRVVSPQRLEDESPGRERRNVKSELATGFPYRLAHASTVASFLAQLIRPPAPKKGLITDLDDTLWRGIVGEVGVRGVTWDLENHSLNHGLYQQFLGSLADAGVLIGVASKNDRDLVTQALGRDDLMILGRSLFPVDAHWGPKSESVARILRAWNIAADSVVFVDDSPIELAEVKAAYPDMECLRFPARDDQGSLALLGVLRDLFGKEAILVEDAIRSESLRRSSEFLEAGHEAGTDVDAFLRSAEAELTLDFAKDPDDPRALELINKTNQFNLNGERYAEPRWREYLARPETFLVRAAYSDRFGPLGTIAVLAGRRLAEPGAAMIDAWVMSCRAFSRRIEHRCLEQLFRRMDLERVEFAYRPTPRNGPLRDFLASVLEPPKEPGSRLTRDAFAARCPALFHRTTWVSHE